MIDLLASKCRPLEGHDPMSMDEIDTHLALVPGWTLVHGAIQKVFKFKDFHHTVGFVNALAWVANTEDHHPDLLVSYGSCTVRFNTHSVGGISINDFICAAKVGALTA